MKIEFNPAEKIIFKIRKHWLTITATGVGFFGLAIAPVIIDRTVGFDLSFLPIRIANSGVETGLFFYCLWLLALWVGFFVAWTDYYLDVWHVTNERIVDIEQKGLFRRDESTIRLENIEDITIDVKGLIPTIFHYGDIRLQSAGARREFVIKNAVNPQVAQKRIQELQDQVYTP